MCPSTPGAIPRAGSVVLEKTNCPGTRAASLPGPSWEVPGGCHEGLSGKSDHQHKILLPKAAQTPLWSKAGKSHRRLRTELTASLQGQILEKAANRKSKIQTNDEGLQTGTEAGSGAYGRRRDWVLARIGPTTGPKSVLTHTNTYVHTCPCHLQHGVWREQTKLIQTRDHLSCRGKMRLFPCSFN